jgi:hypothetical protein
MSARSAKTLLFQRIPDRVFHASDGILDFAFGLIALAVGFQLGVTDDLAGCFFDGTLGLLGRAGDTIFVHVTVSPFVDALVVPTRTVREFVDAQLRVRKFRGGSDAYPNALASPRLGADPQARPLPPR